ncbi:hypothetical protein TorRG33x02_311100 [Trema orientale]|uniref:Uncharacterized protein n=1 Tax=Trema orientale TaxID=63057 RepID=A0A2P5BRK1_TREOI|nr:hypothetical protein TorRG33x02_311100 [Trema orientale]
MKIIHKLFGFRNSTCRTQTTYQGSISICVWCKTLLYHFIKQFKGFCGVTFPTVTLYHDIVSHLIRHNSPFYHFIEQSACFRHHICTTKTGNKSSKGVTIWRNAFFGHFMI